MKFGRTYQMDVLGRSGLPIVLGFPTTLELSITHNIFASANSADFSLYGLSTTNRSEISFNQFLKTQQYYVKLRAGYISQQATGLAGAPSSLPLIFNGYVNVAYTERNGPDLITRINAFDNGDITAPDPGVKFVTGVNDYTAKIGTPFEVMVQQVMKRLIPSGINPGTIQVTPLPGPVTGVPRTFTGRVWTALEQLAAEAAGAHVYIEQGVCHMLGQNDVLPVGNSLAVLQSSTGLLGVPKYTNATIICSCVFEPSLTIGSQIELLSETAPMANGLCKIVAYTHHGVISGVESGDLISDITLMPVTTPLGAAS